MLSDDGAGAVNPLLLLYFILGISQTVKGNIREEEVPITVVGFDNLVGHALLRLVEPLHQPSSLGMVCRLPEVL